MRIVFIMVAALMTACSADDGLASMDRTGLCAGENGCGDIPGQVCRPGLMGRAARCVLPARDMSGTLYLEIHPRQRRMPPMAVGPVLPSTLDEGGLQVGAPTRVTGRITHDDGNATPVGDARLVWSSPSVIPGRPIVFDVRSQTLVTGTAGSFDLLLPPGAFRIQATPTVGVGRAGPTEVVLDEPRLSSDMAASGLTLRLTAPDRLIPLEGRLVVDRLGQWTPLAGATVRVVEQADDMKTIQALVNAVARSQNISTDTEGRFRLWVAPVQEEGLTRRLRLLIGPIPGAALQGLVVGPAWQLTTKGLSPVKESPTNRSGNDAESSTLQGGNGANGDVPEGTYVVRLPPVVRTGVEVVWADAFGVVKPVPGAQVVLRSSGVGDLADVRSVLTNEKGQAESPLLPVAYSVVALPPVENTQPIGLCRPSPIRNLVPEPGGSWTLRCEPRLRLEGTVLAAGRTMPLVQIEALRRPDGDWNSSWRQQTTTNEDGAFRMDLPRGVYDLVLQPPASQGWPRKRVSGVAMPPSGQTAAPTLEIELDAPRLLTSRITSDGKPLEATVDIYAVGTDGATWLAGRTVTLPDGTFEMLLPRLTP